MSTGNLRLIQSQDVKDVLLQHYAYIDWSQQFRDLYRPAQLALMQTIPELLSLEQQYSLFQESSPGQCGAPGSSCSGVIPWSEPGLVVSEAQADGILERLRARPEARSLYQNMAKIQGQHYSNLTVIYGSAAGALVVLEEYLFAGR